MRVPFLFLDGVGLGEDDPAVNPLVQGLPSLRGVLKGRALTRVNAPQMLDPGSLNVDSLAESTEIHVGTRDQNERFAYAIATPVSVGRGQSAMVSISMQKLPCRKDLLYNGSKMPQHPVASLHLKNQTGLTL